MQTVTSFRALIQALGGAAKAAPALGIRRLLVQAMMDRDSIAPYHWPAFEKAALAAGIPVSASDFAQWYAARSGRRPKADPNPMEAAQ